MLPLALNALRARVLGQILGLWLRGSQCPTEVENREPTCAVRLIDVAAFGNEKSSNIELWGRTCLDKWESVSVSPI
jgi:hypothetical protein